MSKGSNLEPKVNGTLYLPIWAPWRRRASPPGAACANAPSDAARRFALWMSLFDLDACPWASRCCALPPSASLRPRLGLREGRPASGGWHFTMVIDDENVVFIGLAATSRPHPDGPHAPGVTLPRLRGRRVSLACQSFSRRPDRRSFGTGARRGDSTAASSTVRQPAECHARSASMSRASRRRRPARSAQ